MNTPTNPLTTALSAAHSAGEILRSMRVTGFECNKKGARDLLTSADLAAEKEIIAQIKQAFPTHHILSEEASPETTSQILTQEHVWIIDPIDGTTNFAHGHFQVGISIAYVERGQIHAGVVHAPFLHETFSAAKGRGAFCNNQPITVGTTENLTDALIATGFPYLRDNLDSIIARVAKVLRSCRDIRRCGAASLDACWAACGRIDGYYETCQVWDIAAGALIAREAGAQVGSLREIPNDWSSAHELYPVDFLVANPILFNQLQELLKL
jgi:myo-inositol-1(or 4)-monophosphatase